RPHDPPVGAAAGGSADRIARARPTRPTPVGSTRIRRAPQTVGRQSLWALRTWLDSWPGVGHVAVGMHRQGYDLQLTQYDERGWRATFYTTGMEHSPTSATGTAWERAPWRATQRAACEALKRSCESTIGSIGSSSVTLRETRLCEAG